MIPASENRWAKIFSTVRKFYMDEIVALIFAYGIDYKTLAIHEVRSIS